MNKKIIKFVGILILGIVIVNFFCIVSNAAVIENGVGTDVIEKFKTGAEGKITDENNKSIITTKNILGAILSIVQIISISVAMIMLIILSIKYMVSSVEERAQIKKHAVVYAIGAIIVFGVNGIIEIIQAFSSNIKY
ncbi:MAG: hypothetical protein J6J60_06750 [Clostridia bacterium]|nr:hypothetical protein [Clostridia bacterium]